jgi:hypothetical protein
LPHPLSAQKLISATYLFPIFSSFWVIKKVSDFWFLWELTSFRTKQKKFECLKNDILYFLVAINYFEMHLFIVSRSLKII